MRKRQALSLILLTIVLGFDVKVLYDQMLAGVTWKIIACAVSVALILFLMVALLIQMFKRKTAED